MAEKKYYITAPVKIKLQVHTLLGLWKESVKHQLEYAIKEKTKEEMIKEIKKIIKLFK